MNELHDIAIITPGVIRVKDTAVLRGLMEKRFQPMLVEVADYVAEKYGMVITESYREPRHPGDVHATDPVRALDLRSWCYETQGTAKQIEADINSKWEYDPKRPGRYLVARIHKVAGGGLHFHVQVHDNTRRRDE
jgi:hypothetical protein